MSKSKSRAAEMRARRWMKSPIRAYLVHLKEKTTSHHRVKPIDADMKRWIPKAEVRAAKEKCAQLNAGT